jgi:hypothetical protein
MNTRIHRVTNNSMNALNSRIVGKSRTASNSMFKRNSRNANNTIDYTRNVSNSRETSKRKPSGT